VRIADAKTAFEGVLAQEGRDADDLDIASAFSRLLDFFLSTPAEDAEFEAFFLNWGTYAFDAEPTFQYTFWRQFYARDESDESEGIWELEYSFHFRPDGETTGLDSGGEMCADPSDANEFRRLVDALPATQYVLRSTPMRSSFVFQPGG
jgi:hypothetical protein